MKITIPREKNDRQKRFFFQHSPFGCLIKTFDWLDRPSFIHQTTPLSVTFHIQSLAQWPSCICPQQQNFYSSLALIYESAIFLCLSGLIGCKVLHFWLHWRWNGVAGAFCIQSISFRSAHELSKQLSSTPFRFLVVFPFRRTFKLDSCPTVIIKLPFQSIALAAISSLSAWKIPHLCLGAVQHHRSSFPAFA